MKFMMFAKHLQALPLPEAGRRVRGLGFDGLDLTVRPGGYPGAYGIGFPIHGLEAAEAIEGVTVFHAGTARDDEGRFLTAGGRVLSVTGVGADLAEARARAYQGVDGIHFDGAHHRTDIAAHAVEGARA